MAFLLALLLSLSHLGSLPAFASDNPSDGVYTRPDITQATSITLQYHQHDLNFENVEFKLFKIADMTELVQFEFAGKFAEYPVDFPETMTDSDWTNMAEILAGYVERDKLVCNVSGKTDARGEIKFADLSAGLYLITGGSHQREYQSGEIKHRVYYHVQPFLISTPGLDNSSKWCYDIAVSPKFNASEDQFISRRVLKSWSDRGFEAYRPEQVLVDLLCDGKVHETVELNDKNNWRYDWEELDNTHQWRIVERLVQDYRVSGRQEGSTYVITNRYIDAFVPDPGRPDRPSKPTDKPSEPDKPDTPDKPTEPNRPTEPTVPTVPAEPTDPGPSQPADPVNPGPDTTEPVTPGQPTGPKLPQTGQLWWPVPVLTFAGLVLFAGGWLLVKSASKSRDAESRDDDSNAGCGDEE